MRYKLERASHFGMLNELLNRKLQDILDRVLSAQKPRELGMILKHELKPFLIENRALYMELRKRANHYLDLSENPEFISIIHSIHDQLKEILSFVDFKKIEDWKVPKYLNDPKSEKIGMEQFCSKFRSIPFVGQWDGQKIYDEYELMAKFLYKLQEKKIVPEKVFDQCKQARANVSRLEPLLEKPQYAWHTWDADTIYHYLSNPEDIDDEGRVAIVKKSADRVVKDLLLFLEEREQEDPELRKTGKKQELRYVEERTFLFQGKEYSIPKNAIYAKVSHIIFLHCHVVGSSVPCKTVYEEHTKRVYESNELENWNWLYQQIRSANRWADRNKLPVLFDCNKENITSLCAAKRMTTQAK